ncbi:MAG: phosphohistidine phosphatase [Oleiphilaceae bacterium]|jgi:phosphohistidine phosphatase
MKLYIMRHAQASFSAPSDRERPITESGIKQTNDLLLANRDQISDINLIWCSDLLRAKQTAGLVSEALKIEAIEKLFLSPDGDIRQVLVELDKLSSDDCLLVVSHQPLVGELVSSLLNGNSNRAHPYATSEVLALELDVLGLGMATLVKQYLPAI